MQRIKPVETNKLGHAYEGRNLNNSCSIREQCEVDKKSTFITVNPTAVLGPKVGVAAHITLIINTAATAVSLIDHCGRASGAISEFVL
jgi:hypothetical protein